MEPRDSAHKLVTILEGIAYPKGHQIERVFESFVETSTTVIQRAGFGDLTYRPDLGPYQYAYEDYTRAFAVLWQECWPDYSYEDIIGLAYMEIASNGKRSGMGQYFTPMHVARIMAAMMLPADGDYDQYTRERPFTVCDPACGSGIMLLAAASQLPRAMIDEGRVEFTGIDLDPLCVKMAQLNVALYGLWIPPGMVAADTIEHPMAAVIHAADLTDRQLAQLPPEHAQRITEQLALFDMPAIAKRGK